MRVPLLIAVLLSLTACPRDRPATTRDATPRAPARPVDSLLGGERGLDHVGVAVRDLEVAREAYRKLGFVRPVPGTLPNGVKNINYYFEDTSYLETLTHWDAAKAPWLSRFLEQHEGGRFFVLAVFSATETAAFLARRGFEMSPPAAGTIRIAGQQDQPAALWHSLHFKKTPIPADTMFFIAYDRKVRDNVNEKLRDPQLRRRLRHPNTVSGTRAVWLAVKSVVETTQLFVRLGLTAGRTFTDRAWGATGREIVGGQGAIMLVEPANPRGAVATFVAARGGGLMGVSLDVRRLELARVRIETNTARTFPVYQGTLGRSLLIPPELTHGIWLELVQR